MNARGRGDTAVRVARAVAGLLLGASLAWPPLHAPNPVRCPAHDQPIGTQRVCGFLPLGPDPTGW